MKSYEFDDRPGFTPTNIAIGVGMLASVVALSALGHLWSESGSPAETTPKKCESAKCINSKNDTINP